jgi:hypothetical protein
MKDLKFISANADAAIVAPGIKSTARKGDKWFNDVKEGDIVNLMITENSKVFGRAVILGKRLDTFANVCTNALEDKNHGVIGLDTNDPARAASALASDLQAAYGELAADEPFTVLSFHMVNNID